MPKISTKYVCQACGYEAPRWIGRCPECSAFSTFVEEKVTTAAKASGLTASHARSAGGGGSLARPQRLTDVSAKSSERLITGISEFDRVLGGGLVLGSLVLIGGSPGIGKSTLLLEAAVRLAERYGSGLYISGEESAEQIRMRADRLTLTSPNLMLAAETDLSIIESHIRDARSAFVIVDSIQTIMHPGFDAAPGTLTQVREGASSLQRLAKEGGVPIFIVGHVNKEGNLAGPRALEHIVDAVLQLEGDEHHDFRILRALKNRFGSTNELGVFSMTETGMESVENPSQLFLSERQTSAPGSVVVATTEGSRPLLVEVQALCAPSYFTSPRRTVTGADFNRVNVALAVIEKRLGMRLGDMDVYVNVVGGIKVSEPALDLGIALAVISSLHDVPVPADACVFGEVGLGGEIRAVSHSDRRANEAARLGFSRCIVPKAVMKKVAAQQKMGPDETILRGVATLSEAVEQIIPAALQSGSGNRTRTRNSAVNSAHSDTRKPARVSKEEKESRSNTGGYHNAFSAANEEYGNGDWSDDA